MIGETPIPDNILDHIRHLVASEHRMAHQALGWQLALDHRRWLLAEVDRLRTRVQLLENRSTCQCCFFGNHTEPCICDSGWCCHPQHHGGEMPQPANDPTGTQPPSPSPSERRQEARRVRAAGSLGNPEGVPDTADPAGDS